MCAYDVSDVRVFFVCVFLDRVLESEGVDVWVGGCYRVLVPKASFHRRYGFSVNGVPCGGRDARSVGMVDGCHPRDVNIYFLLSFLPLISWLYDTSDVSK